MDSQKQSVVDRIKQANNILVTVSANPSVDQLASCVGLTIMLNELGKHATAVFSGNVPSTIEFLQPEKTLEKNTDSLRDFIIALDKSKADKLRYKVEDKVVKIFITPYRTSIGEKDLEFSQGDFNVDAVVCLGIHEQRDLDQAITSHGRILHDATVIGINTKTGNNIATLNWQNSQASSLSEMVASMIEDLDKDKKVLDTQVATALLTGVVAETDRFSNDKTSPDTMKVSAQLMAAGANQQLVATKLEAPPPPPPGPPQSTPPAAQGGDQQSSAVPPKSDDGTLRINHKDEPKEEPISLPPVGGSQPDQSEDEAKAEDEPKIHIDENGQLRQLDIDKRQFLSGPEPSEEQPDAADSVLTNDDEDRPSGAPPADNPKLVTAPPTLGGTLTANSRPEDLEPTTDPLSLPNADQPLLNRDLPTATHGPTITPPPAPTPPLPGSSFNNDHPAAAPKAPDNVASPSLPANPAATPPPDSVNLAADDHATPPTTSNDTSSSQPAESDVDSARSAVESAVSNGPANGMPQPIAALGAQPLGSDLHHEADAPKPAPTPEPPHSGPIPDPSTPAQPLDLPLPPTLTPPASTKPPTSPNGGPSSSAPPVPPPMMPLITPNT